MSSARGADREAHTEHLLFAEYRYTRRTRFELLRVAARLNMTVERSDALRRLFHAGPAGSGRTESVTRRAQSYSRQSYIKHAACHGRREGTWPLPSRAARG